VWFDVRGTMSATEVSASLKEPGVLIGAYGPTRMRAVTHLDVDRDGITMALEILRRILT
jgi:threonine aldolase